jgi:dolichol-phosphate mannosyltransferase
VVVGSRYLTRMGVPGWPRYRLTMSVAANRYVRLITGLGVRDVTSGFKCWHRDALASVLASPVRSSGYSIQFEMLYYAARNGHRITEVPIVFVDRQEGASKMSGRVIGESIYRPWQLVFASVRRRRATPGPPLGFDPSAGTPVVPWTRRRE